MSDDAQTVRDALGTVWASDMDAVGVRDHARWRGAHAALGRLVAEVERLTEEKEAADWLAADCTARAARLEGEVERLRRNWDTALEQVDRLEAERDEARRTCEKAVRERRSSEQKEDDWHSAYERSEARVARLEAVLREALEDVWAVEKHASVDATPDSRLKAREEEKAMLREARYRIDAALAAPAATDSAPVLRGDPETGGASPEGNDGETGAEQHPAATGSEDQEHAPGAEAPGNASVPAGGGLVKPDGEASSQSSPAATGDGTDEPAAADTSRYAGRNLSGLAWIEHHMQTDGLSTDTAEGGDDA